MNNSFGEYLRSLRKEKGLTLVGLSKLSGVSNPYLSQIENNKFVPSPGILRRLSKPLEIDYTFLLSKAGYVEDIETLKAIKNTREERVYKLKNTNASYTVDLSNLGEGGFDLEGVLKGNPDPPFYGDVQLTEDELSNVIDYIEFLLKKRTGNDFD